MLNRTSQPYRFIRNITSMVLLLAALVFFHHCSLVNLFAEPVHESCCATSATGPGTPMSNTVECCHSARVLLPDTLKAVTSAETSLLKTFFKTLPVFFQAGWRSDLADASPSFAPVLPDAWTFTEKVLQKSLGTHAPPRVG
ncbi:MAG TPA: hypothetical protein VNQ90_12700 [Chthoniobacteraceae bacterium]|nr:hypothetical protein [Chthoniobacteraceae bacterium]